MQVGLLALAGMAYAAEVEVHPPGDAIAAAADTVVRTKPRLIRNDCSGLIETILARAGRPLKGNTASLWALAQQQGWVHTRHTPTPGDLVFFDNTYDKDHDGRADAGDRLSHIAVVIRVEPDNTVVMAHKGTFSGVSEIRMNLDRPDDRWDEDGKELNSWLAKKGYVPDDRRFTSHTWRGFATIDGIVDAVDPRPVSKVLRGEALKAAIAVPRLGEGAQAGWHSTAPVVDAEGPEVRRARRGRPIPDRAIELASCNDLWLWRNAVYARHGYAFTTERAHSVFAATDWYVRDPAADKYVVAERLTETDRDNLVRILKEEGRCGR